MGSQENLGMTTALKIALGVVLVMTMGEAKTDLESIVRDMRMEMNEMKDKLELLELKSEPVYIHTCGSHDRSISSIGGTINYIYLLYSSTNTEVGGLDISSGLFSSPHPGTYMVTWTLIAYNFYPDKAVIVSLRKNNEIIRESRTYSSNAHMYAQGGRSLFMHLDLGDTLDLYCEDCSEGVDHITFCVSLTTEGTV